jgi:Cytochrome c554 and c-prime
MRYTQNRAVPQAQPDPPQGRIEEWLSDECRIEGLRQEVREDKEGIMKIPTIIIFGLLFAACTSPPLVTEPPLSPPPKRSTQAYPQRYQPDTLCRQCHVDIYRQHSESHHARSFTNPLFQAQYFQEVLPRAAADPAIKYEAERCIACHSPIDHLVRGMLTSPEQSDPALGNVACDLCHTTSGHGGEAPGNGEVLSRPNEEQKFGPFRGKSRWHAVYHELQTKSELCGICHNAVNHNGLEIKSTYSEWKASRFAAEGIQCQDCHMSLEGHLKDNVPVYDKGKAAVMTVGSSPLRSRLYTHRFPGAHSGTQIIGAGAIYLEVQPAETSVTQGGALTVEVVVHNERTGHKMPSGCADIRLLWLELEARSGNTTVFIPANAVTPGEPSDIAGGSAFDQEMLGEDVPRGSRVYRTIFLDREGRWTYSTYDAVRIAFDNRLNPGEMRKETYRASLPQSMKGAVEVRARLNYLLYPTVLTKRFGLERQQPFEMAVAKATVTVN